MKVIVWTSHDRHRDDEINVYQYTEDNLSLVKSYMEERWPQGKWGYLGDLPSDNGLQFGRNDEYYDSYAIVEVM